ncbi:cyclic lactone autoinducer peptide [Romboutsia maritimum]|uniref:Cyclic lactone autoinducer peptide n=1 Tax=Romboutsia maritimum TaxID=2020948 RepID=A0A371IR46_9FIRM|nr:cyclic lactone autoinducer peptide [Romboutsia maritimum]RDY22948.1 cyclic lactone autoinducer peptide [Romboutsia maritimum]
MKKCALKIAKKMGSLAVLTTAVSANTACTWFNHQPEMPKDIKKFKRI